MRRDDDARVLLGGTGAAAVAAARAAVDARLAGAGPALVPMDPVRPRNPPAPPRHLPEGTAVVLETSGSSGRPRPVALGTPALVHSAHATHTRLGGDGHWVLALPIHHVAGWQVLVRGAVAGTEVAVVDTTAGFDPEDLPAAVARLPGDARRYTALVPTQLVRVLARPAAADALAALDAVLVGGAAAPAALLARARTAGIAVVTTYGMTETAGGCVYDGVPLDGVVVAAVGGRLEIRGPVLATAYLDPAPTPADPLPADLLDDAGSRFVDRDGQRWFRTADVGTVAADGGVTVHGRADDAIVTGGLKVHPGPVEEVLAAIDGVAAVTVVGVPDAEWGSAVTAVVVPDRAGLAPELAVLRAAAAARLGPAHAPRRIVVVDELPLRGPGKVDRSGAAALAARILATATRP